MEPRDGNSGDASSSKKKRAPSARKRTTKAVNAEQNGATATERELAPTTEVRPAQDQASVADGSAAATRNPGQRTSGERPADLGSADGNSDEGTFGERDADRAADVAADLKSWMDTRQQDRDAPREVL
jgi:hypothetical protein